MNQSMGLSFHPTSDVFPMMDSAEYEALREDIRVHGLREPILLYKGKILDGRNRYRACEELGIEPAVREWEGNGSTIEMVVSLNLHRRHLTASQKACVSLKMLPLLEAEAKERERQGGKLKGRAKFTYVGKATEQAGALIGVAPRYVSEIKRIYQESPKDFDSIFSGKRTLQEVVKERKTKERQRRLAKRIVEAKPEIELHCGDFRDVPDSSLGSVHAIITDPPYGQEHLDLYAYLGRLAARVLVPSGHLLVMTGQAHLPKVMDLLSSVNELTYVWTLAYLTPGSSTQVFGRRVKSNWKPIVWFTKGPNTWEHVEDVVKSERPEKTDHPWQQSEAGMVNLVERLTVKGQTVLDPMCGTGTVGVAAATLGRSFVGIDIDPQAIATARERFGL